MIAARLWCYTSTNLGTRSSFNCRCLELLYLYCHHSDFVIKSASCSIQRELAPIWNALTQTIGFASHGFIGTQPSRTVNSGRVCAWKWRINFLLFEKNQLPTGNISQRIHHTRKSLLKSHILKQSCSWIGRIRLNSLRSIYWIIRFESPSPTA